MEDKNVPPYYDDFDPTKKYYQILFNPGRAVQARELSQIQSLLQNQIANFGSSIYKQGSMVIPGQIAFDTTYPYVKLQPQYLSVDINLANFAGKKVIGTTSGALATVLETVAAEDSDPNTLFVKYETGISSIAFTANTTNNSKNLTNLNINATETLIVGSLVSGTGIPANSYITSIVSDTEITINNNATATFTSRPLTIVASDIFTDAETLLVVNEPGALQQYGAVAAASASTGFGSRAQIQEGIYYVNGFFVLCDTQSLILDKYSNTPSYRIGLQFTDKFVSYTDDATLDDPASGSTNFNAIGADRYWIDLVLTKVSLIGVPSVNFIELLNLKNGLLQSQVNTPSYSVLEQEFARRSFDDSGNYTVKPFTMEVKEHLNDGSNFGVYADSQGGDESKLVLAIEPGKAYVQGYEITSQSTKFVVMDKSRDTLTTVNQPFSCTLGNYVDVDHVKGTFNPTTYDTVNLIDGSSRTVGTAIVRGFKLISGIVGSTSAKYRLWLFDISMIDDTLYPLGVPFSTVRTISSGTIPGTGKTAKPILDVDNNAVLNNAVDNVAIIPIPTYAIKTFLNDDNSITNEYTVRRFYTGAMTGNSITLTAGSGALFESFDVLKYHLSVKTASGTATGNGIAAGDVIDLTGVGNSVVLSGSPTGSQVVITVPTIASSTVEVVATLVKSNIQAKTKTLTSRTESAHAFSHLITLDKADIFEIESVIDDTTMEDITNRFFIDNGQRDNEYQLGSLTYDTTYNDPASTVTITYTYFAHGSGDFFSVDSYDSVIPYGDIPLYISPTSGIKYDLINCLDFRPRRNDTDTGFSVVSEIVEDGGDFTATYDYYTGQINKLYLDYLGNFKIIYGNSGVNPHAPQDPTDGMVLYTIKVPPYTFNTQDVKTTMVQNRGYTMRDIGALDARIGNLEYYTSLSLLEQNTADMFIDDGTGNNRFKNGFVVDNFGSFAVSNVALPDYQATIDPVHGFLRPTFFSDNVGLDVNDDDSSNYVLTGQLITLPYTTASLIKQNYASTFENINPYNIFNWIGTMSLTPTTDDWYDTLTAPDRIIATTDDLSEAMAAQAGTTVWGSWQTTWLGQVISDVQLPRPTNVTTTFSAGAKAAIVRIGDAGPGVVSSQAAITASFGGRTPDVITGPLYTNNGFKVVGQITTQHLISQEQGQTRTGTQYTVQNTTSSAVVSNNIIGTSVIPFMRSNTIQFSASGMRPNTKVYPFFDNIDIGVYCKPTGGSLGDPLVTNISGSVSGEFDLPNNASVRFRTGTRVFKLTDSQANNNALAQTTAFANYEASGTLQTSQQTIQSTTTPKLVATTVTQDQTIVGTNIKNTTQTIYSSWYDPLAQSFLIDSAGGVFLNKINLYFKTKDAGGLPVTLQIRNMVNGYPGPLIVPFSEVVLTPDQVNVSDDSSAITTFEFSNPIYLQDKTDYCFVLLSNSNGYNVWVSEIGGIDLLTGAAISEQPYAGSLFKSQNASTWTADQMEDIKFEIFRCVFDTEVTGEVILDNEVPTTWAFDADPFTTTNASGTVSVRQLNHNLKTGQKVTFAGVSGSQNGIADTAINGQRTVTVVDYDNYTFVAGASDTASSSGRTGGSGITATRNIRLDLGNVISQNMIPSNTSLAYGIKTKEEESGTLSSNFATISPGNNIVYEQSQTILNTDNAASNPSVRLQVLLASANDAVSPVLDVTRQSLVTIGNRINDVDTDETLPESGDAIARYITKSISLSSPATALNVYFAAVRPQGCEFEVYIKYLQDDMQGDAVFDDLDYVLMDSVSYPNFDGSSFLDYQFSLENLNPFSMFAVKIVMLAADTADAPTIQQFRAIATGT